MRYCIFPVTGLVAILGVVSIVRAESNLSATTPNPLAQIQLVQSQQQILTACTQGQAATLPIPFTDLSPNQWAFKAVMTMYYCGAFRQATPATVGNSQVRSLEVRSSEFR